MLQQVVYVSAAVGEQSDNVLGHILSTARRNNPRDGLTGMLLTADQCYFQILEGPGQKLDACLERIKRDRRHTRIVVTARSEIEKRLFPDWSMGYEKFSALGQAENTFKIRDIAEKIDFEFLKKNAPEIVCFMRTFFLSARHDLPTRARA